MNKDARELKILRREVDRLEHDLNTLHAAYEERCNLSVQYIEELAELRGKVGNLFSIIAHGDKDHRAWLRAVLKEYFK